MKQYTDIATKAMINDGKKADEVKIILANRGLYKDYFDMVLERAQLNYTNWFNEIGGKPATAFELYQQSIQTTPTPKSLVEVINSPGEDYALQFCALIGSKRYYQLSGRSILYAVVNQALLNEAVITNGETQLKQAGFARAGGKAGNPYLRVVTVNNQREAAYPYLHTEITTNFYTQRIVEWGNGDPVLEAEIEGNLNRTLPISFFATDYAVNRLSYQTQMSVEIRLSAVVLELSEAIKNPDNRNPQSQSFRSINKYGGKSYFLFEAIILEIKVAPIDILSVGYVMTLKFGDDERAVQALTIDAYINHNSIKADKIQQGMFVKGILWFQGEISG
jgi:hypothetical protein